MNDSDAIRALGALAHDHRLRIFRLLVREGPSGKTAGAIAQALEIPPPALSFHLSALERARLLTSRRSGRHVTYAVVVSAVRGLIEFLTEDCCGGRPELCGGARVDDGRGARP